MIGTRKQSDPPRPPFTSHLGATADEKAYNPPPPPLTPAAVAASGAQNPNIIYQHIHDTAAKRISTLDYLRKTWVDSSGSSVWHRERG